MDRNTSSRTPDAYSSPQHSDGSPQNNEGSTQPRSGSPGADDLDFGSYFRRIGDVPLLSAEDEKTLGWNIRNDACAVSRDRLIRSNLRLVVCIARKFVGRGLSLPDLVAEGNLGLLRAVDRFDPAHGARFSTYASWWIKHAIRRGIRQTKEIVHIPAHVKDLSAAWQRAATRQQTTSGIPMTTQEIAASMSGAHLSERKLRNALAQHLGSSNPPIPADAEQSLPDTREPPPEGRMMKHEELAKVHDLLRTTTAREASAIRMRFGMDGHKPRSLTHIGEVLGISRESARKLLVTALNTMGTALVGSRREVVE